jgi:hypothetical protein
MRKRSQSFYAKSEEEFKEQVNEEDTYQPRKRSRISSLIEDSLAADENKSSDDEDELSQSKDNTKKSGGKRDADDNLGVTETFCITENTQTMEDEEETLMNSINNISQSIRNRDRRSFLEGVSNIYLSQRAFNLNQTQSSPISNKISRSFSSDSMNIIDFENIYPSTMPHTNDILINVILNDPILSQNIKLTDEVIKIIVLGEESIGKTLFIDQVINNAGSRRKLSGYAHSKCLDIKKKKVKLLDRILTLELWDTNREIQNSKLCESIDLLTFSIY